MCCLSGSFFFCCFSLVRAALLNTLTHTHIHTAFPTARPTDRYAVVRWRNRCGTTTSSAAATGTATTTGATTTTTAAAAATKRCPRRSCRCRRPQRCARADGSPTCWCSPPAFSCVAGRRTWCASWAPNGVAAEATAVVAAAVPTATDGLRRCARPSCPSSPYCWVCMRREAM